ncbi:MAG: DUF4169 family protein [Pararhodobacter sp.]
MAKIVNLRTRRKQAARAAARKSGDANAARHGISAQAQTLAATQTALQDRRLDGHQRCTRPPADPPEEP